MTDSTDRGDDLVLLPNGMVRLVFDDREIMLRRPTIGVLRERREALHALNDETSHKAAVAQGEDEARRRIAQIKVDRIHQRIEEALADDELDEALVESLYADKAKALSDLAQTDREGGRELNAWIETKRLEWARDTVGTLALADGAVADDEWPSWITDAQFAPKLIGHWRTVPSRSGGS